MPAPMPQVDPDAPLGEQLAAIIEQLPGDRLSLRELLATFGDEGLLLLVMLLTLVFLIPVSIPGVSTVFGGAILLVGISRLSRRPLWLPRRLQDRVLPAERLRPALGAGLRWVRRMERISRPRRLHALADGRVARLVTDLAFILASLLLMLPFSFVPFSNTLPAVALLLYSIGMIQRDGGAILLGHAANVGTMVYFAVLVGGGSAAVHGIFQKLTG